jgi:hypothetical protein
MRFMKTYGRVAFTALAYAMNDEFSRVLHQQMEYFSSKPNADAINRVKGEISEVWYSSLSRHSLEVSFFSLLFCSSTFAQSCFVGIKC